MTHKELEQIREYIACPQFGDPDYGRWGILNVEQRKAIKKMLEWIDTQDTEIYELSKEIEELTEDANRRKAENYALWQENNRLNSKNAKLQHKISELKKEIENCKDKAVQEFADRLIEKYTIQIKAKTNL